MDFFGIDFDRNNFVFTRKNYRNLGNNRFIPIGINSEQLHNIYPGHDDCHYQFKIDRTLL